MNLDDILHLLALAANLEAEGQYNHAKLFARCGGGLADPRRPPPGAARR